MSVSAGVARRVAVGSGWSLACRLVVTALGLATGVILTRLLAPEEMGVYLLALSFIPFAVVLAGAGLGQLCVRFVAGDFARGDKVMARRTLTALWKMGVACAVGLALLSLLLTMSIGEYLFKDANLVVVGFLLGGLVFATALQMMASDSFRGFSDIKSASIYGGPLASLLIVASLIFVGVLAHRLTVTGGLLIVFGATAVSAACGILALRRRWRSLPLSNDPQPAHLLPRNVLAVSLPLATTTALLTVLATVDLWVLGAFRPAAEAASYGVAVRTATLVAMPLLVIYGVLGPVIASLYASGELKKLERTIRGTTLAASVPSLILAGGFVVAGSPLLAFVYGEHYRAGGPALALLSLGQFMSVLTGVCGLLLAMTGHQRLLLTITLASVVLTVVALLIVVPVGGMIGAAVISAVGVAGQNVALMIAARRATGVWSVAAAPWSLTSISGGVS